MQFHPVLAEADRVLANMAAIRTSAVDSTRLESETAKNISQKNKNDTMRMTFERERNVLIGEVNKLQDELDMRNRKFEANLVNGEMKLAGMIQNEQAKFHELQIALKESEEESIYQFETIRSLQESLQEVEVMRNQDLIAWEAEHEKGVIERARGQSRLAQLETALVVKAKTLAEESNAKNKAIEELKAISNENESLSNRLKKAQKDSENNEESIDELKAKEKKLQGAIKVLEDKIEKVDRLHAIDMDKIKEMKKNVVDLKFELDTLKIEFAVNEEKMKTAKEKAQTAKQNTQTAKQKTQTALSEIAKPDKSHETLEAEIKKLKEMDDFWWTRLHALRDEMKSNVVKIEEAVPKDEVKQATEPKKKIYFSPGFPTLEKYKL